MPRVPTPNSLEGMRLLHTSDWHIGRTFHGHSTDEHLATVLAAIAAAVAEHQVDVVIVAGDIFDSSTPKSDAFTMLNDAVLAIRAAGAHVILTSGNHDGPARLGHMAAFAAAGGVHLLTDLSRLATPVILPDAHGAVAIYGVPYVHPSFLRSAFPEFGGTTQEEALAFAMARIREDAAARSAQATSAQATSSQVTSAGAPRLRTVVAAHCFTTNITPTAEDSGAIEERDITRGGLDLVPASTFDGPDYVALGHIHSRAELSPSVRYSGAPLRFSFGEEDKPRGFWIADLDATGLAATTWHDLPVPREVSRLIGTLEWLLADGAYDIARDHWVDVVLTDDSMPLDAMRRIQDKFPYAVTLAHRPTKVAVHGKVTYFERVQGKSDTEIVGDFLAYVRNGEGPTDAEQALISDAMQSLEASEASR